MNIPTSWTLSRLRCEKLPPNASPISDRREICPPERIFTICWSTSWTRCSHQPETTFDGPRSGNSKAKHLFKIPPSKINKTIFYNEFWLWQCKPSMVPNIPRLGLQSSIIISDLSIVVSTENYHDYGDSKSSCVATRSKVQKDFCCRTPSDWIQLTLQLKFTESDSIDTSRLLRCYNPNYIFSSTERFRKW